MVCFRARYHKYKGRYADVVKAYTDLQNENAKIKNVMQQTQVGRKQPHFKQTSLKWTRVFLFPPPLLILPFKKSLSLRRFSWRKMEAAVIECTNL